MKSLSLLTALLAVLSLSGCVLVPDDDYYGHEYRHGYYEHEHHYRDGRRDAGWCYYHPYRCGY